MSYEVVSHHSKENVNADEIDDSVSIAICGYSKFNGISENEIWALPLNFDEAQISECDVLPVGLNGSCKKCKSSSVSISRSALCPICRIPVECT